MWGLSLLVHRCVARERDRHQERRRQRKEWNERCLWKVKKDSAFQTFKLYISNEAEDDMTTCLFQTFSAPMSPSTSSSSHCHHRHHLLPNALIPSGCRKMSSCCVVGPHQARLVSYNFVQQQTANNVALLSVFVHVCVSKSPSFMNGDVRVDIVCLG